MRCRDTQQMVLSNACFQDLIISSKGDSFTFPEGQAYVQDCLFENIRFRSVGARLTRFFGNANEIRKCNSEQSMRAGYDGNLFATSSRPIQPSPRAMTTSSRTAS